MADQYYHNIQFALSLNGDFLDWSKYNRKVNVDSGIVASTAVVKYGSYSAYFPAGVSKSLMIDYIDWVNNTLDFTFEFWVYAIKSSSPASVFLLGQCRDSNNYWKLYLNSTTNEIGLVSSTGTSVAIANGYIYWDQWAHITLTRTNGTINIFVNGSSLGTGTISFPSIVEPLLIGGLQHSGTVEFFVGYMSDIIFTQGISRYSTNFTAPTALYEQIALKAISIQSFDSISGTIPLCSFDVSVASGAVRTYQSNSAGNITIKIPDGVSVEISAYATGYKKARLEASYHPNVVQLNLSRNIVNNSAPILQLSPLVYFSGENDPADRMLNSGLAGGYENILNQTYLQRHIDSGSRVTGKPYYSIPVIGNIQVAGTVTGMSGLTLNSTGQQDITDTGGCYCGWVKPTGVIGMYNESAYGVTANNQDQKFLIHPYNNGSDNGYGISVGTNGAQIFIHRTGNICDVLSWQGSIQGWTHIAVVLDSSGNPSLYVNGVLVRSTNVIPPGRRYMGLWIGTDWYGDRGSYSGSFAEFCMFGKKLSQDEIKRVMNGYASFKIQGQVLDSNGVVRMCNVRAYSHETGKLQGECTTDSNGYYSLITTDQSICYVVCTPVEINDISSNAMVYSNIIPSV